MTEEMGEVKAGDIQGRNLACLIQDIYADSTTHKCFILLNWSNRTLKLTSYGFPEINWHSTLESYSLSNGILRAPVWEDAWFRSSMALREVYQTEEEAVDLVVV
jgi:hypothetical protein